MEVVVRFDNEGDYNASSCNTHAQESTVSAPLLRFEKVSAASVTVSGAVQLRFEDGSTHLCGQKDGHTGGADIMSTKQ